MTIGKPCGLAGGVDALDAEAGQNLNPGIGIAGCVRNQFRFEAVKQRLRNGLVTWPDALRELGITDPYAHAKNIQEANALLDSLGLILDCDPRKVAAAGASSQPQPTEEKPDDAADEDEAA